MTRRDRLGRAMTVTPLKARQGPCRCAGPEIGPHHLGRACYMPGRPPNLAPGLHNLVITSAWDMETRLAEAHAEGYGQAEADAEDAGMVAPGDIVAALANTRTSAAVRRALADVLGVQESQLGKAGT